MIILGHLDISAFLKAYDSLKKANQIVAQAINSQLEYELLRDGVIQRFEYTFELSWKTLKRILAYKGLAANSPRDVLRLSAKESLISDLPTWFLYLEKRNMTSHVYNAIVAEEVYAIIADFILAVEKLIDNIKHQ